MVVRFSRRQQQILEQVHRDGFVTVEDLATAHDVTTQTVRRDINLLCQENLLRRYHGGAGLPSTVENLPYDRRQVIASSEKQRIAQMVAKRIPERASLFVDIGTTTEEIARALLQHQHLRVITNNLNVARILAPKTTFEVIVTGGVVRHVDLAVVGELGIETINQFKVDYGILGTSGIDADGTLLDFDVRKVRISQAIIANSRKVIMAADFSKFGRNAMVRAGHISDVNELYTDREPPQYIRDLIADTDVKLFMTGKQLSGSADEPQ